MRFLLCVTILLSMPTCVKNAEGRRAFALLPADMLNSQAALAYEEQKKSVPISSNSRDTRIVKRVAERLILEAGKVYGQYSQGFQWEVELFNQPDTINAYCMPGGKIGIYSGILPVCENEAALAAVMGHEISHALLKHGNERVSQQLGLEVVNLALQVGLAEGTQLDSNMQTAILQGVGIGSQLGVLLPFSRYHEKEADRMGLRIMAMAGYDPGEAPNLWRRMKAKSGGKAPPVLLSTHPSNDQRIADLEALQQEVAPLYGSSAKKYGLGDKF